MAFSSLDPRNPRRPLVQTRSTKGAGRQQPARHLRLWEAIRLTRSELSDWQQRTALIDGLFRQHILPRETQLTGDHGELTDRLMDAYAEHWLGSAEQALLNLWIADNLQSLAGHPFASAPQREALNRRWQQLQAAEAAHAPPVNRTGGSLLDDLFDDELDDDDDVFDFGWHAGGQRSSEPTREDDTDVEEPQFENPDSTRESAAENHSTETEGGSRDKASIEQLEQRLSVERLFRQLARTLHPDLEQDEARKAEKHELMSECLLARKNKDINTLLTLYCEHVGDLPDDLEGNEHEELIQALEQQLRQLQNELRLERFGNPLHVQIVERYSATHDKTSRQRVLQHAASLDLEIERVQHRLQELDSREGLLAELAERREIELNRMTIDSMTGYTPGR